VLLDEIEKAHPDVLGLFLHVFDDGWRTDARGRAADASNALFLLTSNLPMEAGMGFEAVVPNEAQAREILVQRHYLRPELVNRLDRVIVFHRLEFAHVQRICVGLLEELRQQLRNQQVGLEWDGEAVAFLARAGHSDTFGARELRRLIERHAKDRIAAGIAQQHIQPGQVVRLQAREAELELSLSR
jgi:ATP-dependent Clp protease ATP-binding subunit ClpC